MVVGCTYSVMSKQGSGMNVSCQLKGPRVDTIVETY